MSCAHVNTKSLRKDFSRRDRPFMLECSLCDDSWEGTNLTKIAKKIAWHWNKNHNGEFTHTEKTQIDTIERGGFETSGNRWSVERIPIYLTAFDVLEDNLGEEDGWAVVSDTETVCKHCLRLTPNENNRVVREDGGNDPEWMCDDCHTEVQLERRRTSNRSLTDFLTD